MYISISQSEFKSSNQRNIVKVRGYNLTKESLKAIIVVLHGMTECKELYSEFAEYLAKNNYGVITYDHIGHGASINTKDDRGFFSNDKGYRYLIEDLKHVIQEAKKFNLPVFLFGHSMGSLVSRCYVAETNEKEIAGLILCGTIGQQWAIDGAIQFAEYMIEKKGPRYRSRKLNQLVTTVSSWKFEKMTDHLEWITRDKEYIKKVKDDEKMNYIFTATGFRDIFTLTKIAGQKETIDKIPKDLPILMVSGSDDILGEYGEGPKRLEQAYKKSNIKDVTLKLYQDYRHNIMQDLDREVVMKDVYDWIEVVRIARQGEKI